ncbi:MAG: class I SAM-dependent methyltransferase, partial [Anaerolineae bacterium]|nr:class I SAM-dependent methyltransferase [Anaerolineae bacterium]
KSFRHVQWPQFYRQLCAEGSPLSDRLLGASADDVHPVRVLDFGCSIGLFLQLANGVGWDSYGVEPDVALARYAQERLGLNVYNGVLSDAHFPDGFFDIVVSFQVFEHLLNPADEMREIARVLRPGGWIAVDVPSIDNVWFRFLRGRHRHFATSQHLYFYTPVTVSHLLEKAGFEVVKVDFPPRSLSLEHVCKHHVALYSRWASVLLLRLLERLNLLQRGVSINMRDVVCVYGRKKAL